MYISEVSGHHSATLAIEKAIRRLEPETQILNINAFNYTNPISEKIVNRIYMGIIKRTPRLWDYLYDNPSVVRKLEALKGTLHRFNSPKFKNLFEKFRPDVVACTQAFPCGMVADYKKTYASDIPLVAVLTDYVPHSYWIYDTIDYYVTPSEEVSARLARKGVAESKIRPFGIPFDPDFNEKLSRTKQEILEHLGLTAGTPTILIMGGGQGLGPIKTIVKSLDKVTTEFQEIIVTGTNKKLFRFLKKKRKQYRKQMHVFGYADNMHELMSVADVIITKPGGITTAEALTKHLPMIIVAPIPGQETNNTAYLTKQRAAIKVDDPRNIDGVIEDLLQHPDQLRRMRQHISSIAKPGSSEDCARLLLSIASKSHG
jgi:processive 1,2-diacylglycerol beta-glucosyltransferase